MTKSAKLLILSLAIMGITTYFVFKLSLSRFKKQVIFQTISEEDKWKDYNELSPATADIIKQYWAEGVGLNFTTEQILNAEHQSIWAWSSAFISWVMRSSGGDTFPVHQTHAHYKLPILFAVGEVHLPLLMVMFRMATHYIVILW